VTWRVFCALLLSAVAGLVQASADEARVWIQRMNEAVVKRNYDGVFTHRWGDKTEVMRIVHLYKNGEMVERVISTDGSGYQQKREGTRWREFRPDKRTVITQTRNRSYGYLPSFNAIQTVSPRYYDIVDAGRVRIDGRDLQQIHLLPKDALRYGYRFWLDPETALPLKSQRVTSDGKVLREISFINPPRLPQDIPEEELKVEIDTKAFKGVDSDRFTPMHHAGLKRAYALQRKLMPPGYRSVFFSSPEQEAKAVGPRARFIVTDGVSLADVYIAPASVAQRPASYANGPWSSYQLRVDDVLVTVVGELPEAAAQAVAQAVRPE